MPRGTPAGMEILMARSLVSCESNVSKVPTPPKPLVRGVERRAAARDQRRRERLHNLLEIGPLSACAAWSRLGLLRHGWSPARS